MVEGTDPVIESPKKKTQFFKCRDKKIVYINEEASLIDPANFDLFEWFIN